MRGVLDSLTFGTSIEDVAPRPAILKQMRWDFITRADAMGFIEYLNYMAGRLNVVWIESGNFDFTVLNVLTSGGVSMDVSWIGYSNLIDVDAAKRDVVVVLNDGTILRRRVASAVNNGNGTESLVMDEVWGQSIQVADIKYVSYLSPYRLESDALDYTWHDREKMTVEAVFRLMPK